MTELTPEVRRLIQRYQESRQRLRDQESVATVHVDGIASKVAAFYERLRGLVDWKEEHLIRRGAIERVLKRRFLPELSGSRFVPDVKPEEIAGPLVSELVRGGHFPNDFIPEAKISIVENILRKYIYILKNNPLAKNGSVKPKRRINFYNWLLEIAACEIEELLDPPEKGYALVECMTASVADRIRVDREEGIPEGEKRIQTYIAVHRSLFHLDTPVISYHLLHYRYPNWDRLSDDALTNLARDIFSIKENLERDLSHPLANKFFSACERLDTPYLLLGDILKRFADRPEELPEKFTDPKVLENLIKEAYGKRLATLKSRLLRMAVYSTLSIFIGGGFSLFLVEVPLAKLFYGRFSPLAVAVDILIPTLLMFILVALVRPPGEDNLKRVVAETKKIAYPAKKEEIYLRVPKKKGFLTNLVITLLYLVESCLSLGFTAWIFYIAQVPWTSVILDAVNIAVVVFAATIIRQRSKELTVEDEQETILRFSFDILTLPIAKVGRWLSAKWREYNIASVFFTALVDMPFATFLNLVEGWSQFLKEQKEALH
jgi:hypothetical protein